MAFSDCPSLDESKTSTISGQRNCSVHPSNLTTFLSFNGYDIFYLFDIENDVVLNWVHTAYPAQIGMSISYF